MTIGENVQVPREVAHRRQGRPTRSMSAPRATASAGGRHRRVRDDRARGVRVRRDEVRTASARRMIVVRPGRGRPGPESRCGSANRRRSPGVRRRRAGFDEHPEVRPAPAQPCTKYTGGPSPQASRDPVAGPVRLDRLARQDTRRHRRLASTGERRAPTTRWPTSRRSRGGTARAARGLGTHPRLDGRFDAGSGLLGHQGSPSDGPIVLGFLHPNPARPNIGHRWTRPD